MGRRQADSDLYRFTVWVIFLIAVISCFMVYHTIYISFQGTSSTDKIPDESLKVNDYEEEKEEDGCCRGIEHLELWGDAVKWGSDFKQNSSEECCKACKEMCYVDDGPCLCDTWVFCGDKEACGSRYGECWLKKQKDTLHPERRDFGDDIPWTSGLIFGKGEGIVKLSTVHGSVPVKLLPACAPRSVAYILELLLLRHCAGCQFYRAESRGNSWDPQGNHIKHAHFGPPYALIQGRVDAHGSVFKDIPQEFSPTIRRGSVAWASSGPDFFISLANHNEWKKTYTVFGYVLPEDMQIMEKISQLPTVQEVWSNVKVSVLETPVPLRFIR